NQTFDDGAGTFGTILDRADLSLSIVDDVAGVRVTASGEGMGTAVVESCPGPYLTNLTDGDDVILTCGSITANVLIGPVEISLGGSDSVSIGTGAIVTVDQVDGLYTVVSDPSSTGVVTVNIGGIETILEAGATWSNPVCDAAVPSIDNLWPANHKFVGVEVLGVTDPEDDDITIVIDSIFQDEPTGGEPDGLGLGSSTAQLRAEREGSGNGRVYHVGFTALDGTGGSCSGEVTVSVPKSQGKKGAAVDDGSLYDSTG
ncbi:MAG: hypothetical protein WBZ45_03205, partial [Acidimicrobiia bacterium]